MMLYFWLFLESCKFSRVESCADAVPNVKQNRTVRALRRPHPLILSSAQPLSSQNHIEISSVEPCADAIPHAIQQCTIRALHQPHPLISKSSELGAREYHLKSRRTYQFVHSSFNCTCVCLPTLDHKALVVVHETMTIRSAMPYVSQRMRPLPCLEIWYI